MNLDDEKVQKGVELAVGLLVARIVAMLLSRSYTKRRAGAPPLNPLQPDVAWTAAIGWSAFLGAAVGIARLLTKLAVDKGIEKRIAGRPIA